LGLLYLLFKDQHTSRGSPIKLPNFKILPFFKELRLHTNANFIYSFIHQRCIYYHITLPFVNFFFMNLFVNYCELIFFLSLLF